MTVYTKFWPFSCNVKGYYGNSIPVKNNINFSFMGLQLKISPGTPIF